MKVKTSPYERAVNALMRSDPKLSEELEAACRADMKRHLDEQAERDSLRAQRDAAVAALKEALGFFEFHRDLSPIAATATSVNQGDINRLLYLTDAALLRAKEQR